MPSSLPTYYLPPPHANHLSRSVPSSKPKPHRPTILDNLLTDLITSTSDLNTSRDDLPIPPSRVKSRYLGVRVENDLHQLKHSISERNLSDTRRSAQDLNLVESLMEDHKRELKEFERVKQQLNEEREENAKLRRENEQLREHHARRIEDMKKANKRALKILMGLQREEFVNWSKGLKPYLNQIDQAVRDRINNWEKSVRSNGYAEYHESKKSQKQKELQLDPLTPQVVLLERRSSSPEPDGNKEISGRKSPSKSVRDRTIRRTRRISGLGLGGGERDRHPFARC